MKKGRLSPAASFLMIILGVVTLLELSVVVGIALIVLGVVMYAVYARIARWSSAPRGAAG